MNTEITNRAAFIEWLNQPRCPVDSSQCSDGDLDIMFLAWQAAIEHFLSATGQYVTNDATRNAAIQAAVEADRQRRGEPVGYFQDVGHYRYEQVGDDFKDDSDVFPLYRAPQPAEPVKAPSDEELLKWAGEEQFFLFCDEDEFLQIAREVLSRYSSGQPAASAKPVGPVRLRDEGSETYLDGVECRYSIEQGKPYPYSDTLAYVFDPGIAERIVAALNAAPVAQEPVAWLRAIDEALVGAHLGVANADDDYDTARRKLNDLLCWQQDVAALDQPTMPPLNDAMRAVLRNENDVYGSEDALYAALCEAALDQLSGNSGQLDKRAASAPFLANTPAPDHWQSVAEMLHARGYVQSAGDIGRVARLLGSVRPEADLAPTPPADGQDREDAHDIEAAAKTLAECMDYPWEPMPEKGREAMRNHAKRVIDAARAQQGGQP